MLLNCGVGEDLRVSWTARWSNQFSLKAISPEYSLEGLMLKLKLQYFGHLMGRTDALEKILMLGKIEGRRRRGRQRMRSLDGIANSKDMSWVSSRNWWWTERSVVLQSMGSQSQTWLGDWTELNVLLGSLRVTLTCSTKVLFTIILFHNQHPPLSKHRLLLKCLANSLYFQIFFFPVYRFPTHWRH